MGEADVITPEELDRIERLVEAATPGEWYPGHLSRDDHPCNCPHILCDGYMGSIADVCFEDGYDSPPIEQAKANQRFIASSRTDVPALLSAVRELTTRAEAAEAEVERLRTEVRIVASLPIPESTEKNTLGWLKARARAALGGQHD